MPQHIGIVGCSAAGAALCYQTVCMEGAALLGAAGPPQGDDSPLGGQRPARAAEPRAARERGTHGGKPSPHAHPEVSLHTPSLAAYVDCLDRGDMPGVAALMLASAHKLAGAGADFLICPDNTIHQAFDLVAARSPLPWLHIAEVVAAEAAQRGYKRLGLTGTRWLVESEVYPEKLAARGLQYQRPTQAERDEINRIIMDELVCGVFTPQGTAYFQQVIARLKAEGCDAVVLGCTEIPLIINDANSPLPTLDSTRLLARAALRKAVGQAQ